MTYMSGLRRLSGLAHLSRSPCAGPLSAVSPAHDDTLAWSWAATCLSAPAAFRSTRHNSTAATSAAELASSSCASAPLAPPSPDPILPALPTDWPPLLPAAASHPSAAASDLLLPPSSADPCLSLAGASPLETSPLALVLSPVQLGVRLWEGGHAASDLPWWAAIPATTLAVRSALLPLSLRAYAASANVALLHRAFALSRVVAEAVAEAAKQEQEQQQQQQQPGGREQRQEGDQEQESAGQEAGGSRGAAGSGGGSTAATGLGRVDLVRRVFLQLRLQSATPSFGWYLGNAAVQVPLVVSLSLSLRSMCANLWPGFTGEGLSYFQDLTAPPVYLQTLSTPFGTAGAILPLALVLLYISSADRSAGGSSPGIHMALKLLVLPLYCAALLQPHAVLLYWTALAATQLGTYELAARLPGLRRAVGVPELLVRGRGRLAAARDGSADGAAPSTTTTTATTDDAAELDELLLVLSESYSKSGNAAAARACLAALLARQPSHESAAQRLSSLRDVESG